LSTILRVPGTPQVEQQVQLAFIAFKPRRCIDLADGVP